jgi:hypothetical protein
MKTIRRTAVHTVSTLVLGLGAIALAGCSGTEDPAVTTSPSPTVSASVTSPSTTTPTAAGTAQGTEAYCSALESSSGALEDISGTIGDTAAAQAAVEALRDVREQAPAEVEQAWADFMAFLEKASQGASQSELAADLLDLTQATGDIATHAQEACGVDLGIS